MWLRSYSAPALNPHSANRIREHDNLLLSVRHCRGCGWPCTYQTDMLKNTMLEDKGTVQPSQEGQRLDRALEVFFPELGLRARRRLCERSAILVDGTSARPGFRVRAGQHITAIPTRDRWDDSALEDIRLVARAGDLAALFKPRGLHTAKLAGSEAPCVEERLHALLGQGSNGFPMLVNRLDFETSGLVAVAMTESGAEEWLAVENAGLVHKRYLAIIHGVLHESYVENIGLATSDRRISRPRPQLPTDPLRETRVTPLAILDQFTSEAGSQLEGPFTLVGCHIRKGARHQIRAHLAQRGTPLLGDTLYGSPLSGPFYLHHAGFVLGEFRVCVLPDWLPPLSKEVQDACVHWLEHEAVPVLF